MTSIGSKATTLLSEVQKQQATLDDEITKITGEAEVLLKAARTVGESWSGSNFGYHGELYYGDYQRPPFGERFSVEWGGIHGIPPNWRVRTPDEVKERIEQLAGTRFARVESSSDQVISAAKSLQSRLLIEFAPLHNLDGYRREKELLSELENLDWADKAHNRYSANALNSFPRMTRDSEAFMQGRILPAHTYYEAVAIQVQVSCRAVQRFWELAQRLLKQLEAQPPQAEVAATHVAAAAELAYEKTERKRTVFLVHGRAEGAQQTVARFLEKIGLRVVILSEQPNRGRTIIEKFEQHADVGFAVALLTPDDVGGLAEDPDNLRPRSRQNVILELG